MTALSASTARSLISQLQNNATLWIGHLNPENSICIGGQTFRSPATIAIQDIQVLTNAILRPGNITLTLYNFYETTHTCGTAIGSSTVTVDNSEYTNKWICFPLRNIALQQNAHYVFRLFSADGIFGLGEAVHGNQHPFTFGEAWNGHGEADAGNYFRYFSLAFNVEVCA